MNVIGNDSVSSSKVPFGLCVDLQEHEGGGMKQTPNIEDKNVPTILTALGSAAVGALAGLLAPSPARK